MIASALRFGAVGVANSLLGYAVILFALSLGFGDFPANAMGYAIGFSASYFLNRKWSFAVQTPPNGTAMVGFLIAASLSYCVNVAILLAARMNDMVDHPASHLAAMAGYSITFYFLSQHFVFGHMARTWHTVTRIDIRHHRPEILFLAGVVATGFALIGINLSHDVVWQFWIARQMLGGATLYGDIWELNPPLWFWSALPIEYLGEWLGIAPLRLLILAVVALGGASAMLMTRLANIRAPGHRLLIMAMSFWLCVVNPLFDFGQREQLTLLCALPYVALVIRRRSGDFVPPVLACAIGLLAAYGFALKHYFIAIPLLLEAWLWLSKSSQYRPVRPETLMLAVCAIVYAAAVPAFAPEFFTRIVPMVKIAYYGYEAPLWKMLILPRNLLWVGALTCLALYRRSGHQSIDTLVQGLLLATLGFGFSYAIQQKGWDYHALPVTALLILALFIRVSADGLGNLARYPLAMIVIGAALYSGSIVGQYRNYLAPHTDRLWSTVGKGEVAFAFVSDPMWYWPVGEERQLVWPSRLYSTWMLPAIGAAEIRGPSNPALQKLGVEILRETSHDLHCNPPALILIERRSSYIVQPQSFDVRGFFLRDPDIRSLIARSYREEPATDYFYVYRRAGQPVGARPEHCRRIVPQISPTH